MSRTPFLLVPLFVLLVPPSDGVAQVNLPRYWNSATGELVEQRYAVQYQEWLRDRQRREQREWSENLEAWRERELPYTADACGLGCEDGAFRDVPLEIE